MMVDFSIKIAFNIFKEYSGCRFVVLDSKRNASHNPIHFYNKLGFQELKERKKGATPMYFDLANNFKFSV